MKNWFVIYTRPRQEKKVANELAKIGIESYCPTKKAERQWSDRKKRVEYPLFTSYCFVHIEEQERNKVFQVPGVVKFLFWLKKPAIVREAEINEIKKWLKEYNHEHIETKKFTDNDKVIIKSGILINQKGLILKQQKGNQLILQLESLGFTLSISKTDISLNSINNIKV